MTLEEFFERYYATLRLRVRRARPCTICHYRLVLRLWHRIAGEIDLAAISDHTLAQFVVAIAEGHSPATANNYRRHVLAVLNFAGPRSRTCRNALELLPRVPWCERIPEYRRLPRIVGLRQLEGLLVACKWAWLPRPCSVPCTTWWESLILFLYNTGLRIGQALAVRSDDVMWERSELRLRAETSKTRIEQLVPLNEAALLALAALKPSTLVPRPSSLFLWPQHSRTLFWHLREMQKLAGIQPAVRFHDLRRTCATVVSERCSPEAAALLLGHTDFRTTARYYIHSGRVLRAAVNSIPQPNETLKIHLA